MCYVLFLFNFLNYIMWDLIDSASFNDVIILLLKIICMIICIIGAIQLIMILIEVPMLALLSGIIITITVFIMEQ